MLSAFFIGYAPSQFIGGLLVLYFGPKLVILLCLILTSVLNILIPVLINYGFEYIIVLRVLIGMLSVIY